MTDETSPIAVIYCRVSSIKQTRQGTGLASQESRCREYARMRGYVVTKVFTDDMSGKRVDRPGILAMLAYLHDHRLLSPVVVIDDISRLARGIDAHLRLRAAIADAGASLRSPSIEFGEDSDSRLVENLLASVSEHQRQKNGEQVVNRMRAKVLAGYYVFQRPVGYKYTRVLGQGALLKRHEPVASILAEALEGFASGRFETQSEVKRFLESQPDFPKSKGGVVHLQRVKDMLRRVAYAGYVEAPDWGVSLRPAKHEPLISMATFQQIQARLEAGAKAPVRKDLSLDFVLRGFIACGTCEKPMTAAWSTSRTGKRHPYYFCHTKTCADHRKSIRRDVLEAEFEAMLAGLTPAKRIFQVAETMFREIWSVRLTQAAAAAKALEGRITAIERKAEQLIDRMVDAASPSLASAFERKIDQLEREKLVLMGVQAQDGKPVRTFEEMFELAMGFLKNPMNLWRSEQIEDKRAVLRLAFRGLIAYDRNRGLRTPVLALPFKALQGISPDRSCLVGHVGIEPTTN